MAPTRVATVLEFEAIGLALPGFGTFIGLGLERLAAFLAHGFIDEQANPFGKAVGALLGEEVAERCA